MAASAYQPKSHLRPAGLRTDLDLSTAQLNGVLDLATQVKQSRQRYATALKGRYLSLLFEKTFSANAHDVRARDQATRRR